MDVTWHGHSCFTIKGKDATIAIDPFKDIGLKEPKLSADILLMSHDHFDHANRAAVSGDELQVIDSPGEYEYSGVMIEGIPTAHDEKGGADRGPNTVFSLTIDGIHFVHSGDLGHTLSDAQVEQIGDVDVLLIPVGGYYTIDGKTAAQVVQQLQPRVTIPMHYDVPGLGKDLAKVLSNADDFIKQVGVKPIQLDKHTWKFKQADLPSEESQVIVFPNP